MPNYSYECSCGHAFQDFRSMEKRKNAPCPNCGAEASQVIGGQAAVHSFKLGWFEHIADEPVYARNKAELRSLCERHGCYATGFD